MHMLNIHSVQNNQYITTQTLTSLNTVGSFPSLYIIHVTISAQSEAGRINLSFSVKFCENDECCEGWRSIMRTRAFGRQQAQPVNHFSDKSSVTVKICWEEKNQQCFYSRCVLEQISVLKEQFNILGNDLINIFARSQKRRSI